MEANELIVCRDAALGYEGRAVLSGLDLRIAAGDYLCVVGENGSGKSTLMKGLLGLLEPMEGVIERAPELKNGAVGYLPQQTQAQKDFPATVYEVVLSGFLIIKLNLLGLALAHHYTPRHRHRKDRSVGASGSGGADSTSGAAAGGSSDAAGAGSAHDAAVNKKEGASNDTPIGKK